MKEVRTHLLVVDLLWFSLPGLFYSLSLVTLEWLSTLFTTCVNFVDIGSAVEAGAVTDAIGFLRDHTVSNVHVVFIFRDGRDDLYFSFSLALEVVASIVKRSLDETGLVVLQSVAPVFLF